MPHRLSPSPLSLCWVALLVIAIGQQVARAGEVAGARAAARALTGALIAAPKPGAPEAAAGASAKHEEVATTDLGPVWRSVIDISEHAGLADDGTRSAGPGEAYGRNHSFALLRGPGQSLELALQDAESGAIVILRIGGDGVTEAVDMPLCEGRFGALCRDAGGDYYYFTYAPGTNPRATLVRADATGALICSTTLGCGADQFNLYNLEGAICNLAVADGVVCLLSTRTMQDGGDGLHHQGSFCACFDAEDLSLIVNHGQNAGHSFDNRLTFDGASFISADLGDNYPRGIVVHKISGVGKTGRVVFTYKTAHGTGPHPHRNGRDGRPLPAGRWSNDNRTYTELADVVPTPRGYLVAFASEASCDNSLTSQAVNEPRNVGVVLASPRFEATQQEGCAVGEDVVISKGASSQPFGYYTFDGGLVRQQNCGVIWLTDYAADSRSTAVHPRMAGLGDGRYVVLWEAWTGQTFRSTHARVIDAGGTPISEDISLGSKVRLARGEGLLASDGCVRWPAVEGNDLVIYTWQLAAQPTRPGSASQAPVEPPSADLPATAEARIKDPALERVLREHLKRPKGPILVGHLAGLSGGLDLSGKSIVDISGLEALTGVTDLNLGRNCITDIGPLAGLNGLQRLSLPANRIHDLTALSGLTGLQYLDLNENKVISDLKPLAGLFALRELHVNRSRISDLTPLGELLRLTNLNLEGNQVSDIGPLGRLSALSWLHLGGNRLSDVGPLVGLQSLQWLAVGDNPLIDLEPVGQLVKLQNLWIDRVRVDSLLFLSASASLKTLGAAGCGLVSLEGLEGCPQLEELHVPGNHISDLRPLSELVHLRRLNLDGNRVTDLAPLAAMGSLVSLNLNWSRLGDPAPLSLLRSLEELELGWTGTQDVVPLASLLSLRWLRLTANPLTDISPLADLPKLENLALDGATITDIHDLAVEDAAPSLKSLALQGTRVDTSEGTQGAEDVAALRARGVNVSL